MIALLRRGSHFFGKTLALPSFGAYKLHKTLKEYLQDNEIHTPTSIQMALLNKLEKDNYLARIEGSSMSKNQPYHITSPTGSGKTLAYLMPILNYLKILGEKGQIADLRAAY